MHKYISVQGAREHNLKNVNVKIPREKITIITGLSGSGKSSLAFDTIYAEGQRRYVESLSAYARQFLEMMQKPDVDLIEGLSPAIAIEQKTTSKNPRSTVGTITEVYDYLKLNEPVGKRLGFLAQEINREVNTIGSKSPIPLITSKIVEVKNELEKIKEQIQNIL